MVGLVVTQDQFDRRHLALKRTAFGNNAIPRVDATRDIAMERYSTLCAGSRSSPDRRI